MAFIADRTWTFAKTMPEHPHWYTVRPKGGPEFWDHDFDRMVELVHAEGTRQKWGKNWYVYLEVDGYKDWTMGWPEAETTIINRRRLDGQGGEWEHLPLLDVR